MTLFWLGVVASEPGTLGGPGPTGPGGGTVPEVVEELLELLAREVLRGLRVVGLTMEERVCGDTEWARPGWVVTTTIACVGGWGEAGGFLRVVI